MFVYKRNGTKEEVSFDQILHRIKELKYHPFELKYVDCAELAKEVISQLVSGMNTTDIDIFTAQRAASKALIHLDYEKLAARALVNNHHKVTLDTFSAKMDLFQQRLNEHNLPDPLLHEEFYSFVVKNRTAIDAMIDYDRDYLFDYFGFNTLYEQNYLLRQDKTVNGKTQSKVIERPQDMIMRVAVFIHYQDNCNDDSLKFIQESYDLMSKMYFFHASPTLFNAGLKHPGCISCFLAATDDSREGIHRVKGECLQASAACGGVAFSATPWRCKGSRISRGGSSNGIVPFIQAAQADVTAFNQGGRRKGSLAVYLHVHHPDLLSFLNLRRHGGDETQRSRNTYLGLWISDLFMKRVRDNEIWSFFDPRLYPNLMNFYGKEYEQLYLTLEKEEKYTSQLRAREVWKAIYETKRDSGIPYMIAADAVNRANNHSHLGPIHNSNLCTEIVEYCENKDNNIDKAETACCTLSSIGLPMFVYDEAKVSDTFPVKPAFDYKKLIHVVGVITRNLNNIIDKNGYPTDSARRGSLNHRPIGIGVQGLADVFHKFKVAFDSETARKLNKRIFETIYYAALSASTTLARNLYKQTKGSSKYAGAYPSFTKNGGCYLSKGILNYQLYGYNDSNNFDWDSLRSHIELFGVRNSLMVALMPTGTTAQMFRNTECFEPSINVGIRAVMGGEYLCINQYFFQELFTSGAWTPEFVSYIKRSKGSIKDINNFPEEFKLRYRTVWEIPQKSLMEMAADRQPFIDQSQSMNLYFKNLTIDNFSSSQMYAHQLGLKTLSYYIRQEPEDGAEPMQVTLYSSQFNSKNESIELPAMDKIDCTVCGT